MNSTAPDEIRRLSTPREGFMRKANSKEVEALVLVSNQLNSEASTLSKEARRLTKTAAELTKEAEALAKSVDTLKSDNT